MNPNSSNSMRIALVAHNSRVAGGISVAQNLISAMARVGPQNRYLVTIPRNLGYEDLCSSVPFCETLPYHHRGGLFVSWFYERFQLPKLINKFEPDMVLSLGNRGLFNLVCPQAVMLQCAYYFYPSEYYGELNLREKVRVLYHKYHLRRILPQTSFVLCQTEVAAKRIRDMYGYKGDLLVIPNPSSVFIDEVSDVGGVPEKLRGLENRLKLFCLTHYYTHKNLEGLVQLFNSFRNELKDVVVVITIPQDQNRNASRLLKSIEALELNDHIVNVGPISQRELSSYYCNCHALILPTFLESFSGTYMEAMLFGVPILTSDLDFAHAVCRDAALYFDPWDLNSIRDAILTLKNDPGLAQRLVTSGKAVLERTDMNWDEIAAAVLARVACVVDSKQQEANA